MFEESTYETVIVKIKHQQKQHQIQIDLPLNEDNEIYIMDLIRNIKSMPDIDQSAIIFYFDPLRNIYTNLQEQQILYIPFSFISSQNTINLRVQSKMSDQLLANSPPKIQSTRSKRSPQRHIGEAFQLVQAWRSLYIKGTINQKGQTQRLNLDKAAVIIGVPRKSLQDYYLLMRNGCALGFDFKANSRKKVGILRNFVKQQKKKAKKQQMQQQKQKSKSQQKSIELELIEIRKQIFGMTEKDYEQQLFRVVSNVSSDEDQCSLIFQN